MPERITVCVSRRFERAHILERVEKLAKKMDRSKSWIFFHAILEYLERHEETAGKD